MFPLRRCARWLLPLNIFVIHILGDLLAFPSIGFIGGHSNIRIAFLFVTGVMLLSGIIWLAGMKYLPNDTAAVEESAAPPN